ncbi:hypothetical protein [Shewanella frigidimarina]|uniref:FAD-binding oxidoreductase n=1 Tax=Shewanella frigidimarina (strain NCIMB 400) TaxID=318167 RepID=Q082Y8_SHEFN|nr:hypothetical protein [Shewanella frigidimarina]ABI71677.1 conserved hypothetical protein [Shewanella frigidimarina NCIMB 400]
MLIVNKYCLNCTALVFASVSMLVNPAQADALTPFTSDGCSAFPNGTFEQSELWLACCQKHDYDYWKGGTFDERLASDKALRACVTNVGQPQIALLMLAGVRVGGTPYLPTQFRWGYGWSYPRDYGALTDDEHQQVELLSGLVM